VRQAEGRSIRDVVSAHGMESHGGDGNNVEEVYRLAKTAVERARAGNGPMFLEFHTYRWREHCGPLYDNDIGYRTIAEFELWKERCPVTRMGEKLEREGVLPPKQREAMAATIRAEFDAAVAFARQSPFPEGTTLLEEVVAP
jgi:TPP-dependent pyruvate/acetoin dehydrogenase alpha subunit